MPVSQQIDFKSVFFRLKGTFYHGITALDLAAEVMEGFAAWDIFDIFLEVVIEDRSELRIPNLAEDFILLGFQFMFELLNRSELLVFELLIVDGEHS